METIIETEQGYLGCILNDGELIKESTLQPKHFYGKSNRELYAAFQRLDSKGDPIDVVTVMSELGDELFNIGGRKFISDLMNSVASLEPFKTYEKYILESWKLRKAREFQQKEIKDLDDLTNLMNELSELELENTDEDYNHKQAIMDLYEKIDKQETGLSGIDTGFTDLNRMLDGFQGGDLIISAARPSMGKTAKMLNHAIHHSRNGGLSVIFSLEMGQEQLNRRMLSTIGRIDGHKMKNPKQYFNQKDWDRYSIAVGELSELNLYIYDKSGQTVQDIRSKVNKLKRKHTSVPMLIMIDYLQLIRSNGRHESKNIEVGEITRSLKELARDTDSPVYLLSQLSRGVEARQDKRPMMSDIRDSGSVEQDADVIEFLYRDDYYNHESPKKNIIEVIIAKQRNGAVGTVDLQYQKEYNLFRDLAHDT